MESWAILIALVFSAGVLLVARAVSLSRDRLFARVVSRPSDNLANTSMRWLAPVWEKLGSTSASVEERLEVIQSGSSLKRFRLQQFLAGIGGIAAATLIAIAVSAARPLSVLQWLIMIVIGFIAAALLYDRALSWKVAARSRKISAQVADAAELLALSVSAGESVPAALRRVEGVIGAELSRHIGSALEQVDNGSSVTRALAGLRKSTRSPELGRLLDTLISAMERGAPLAQILREQARDLRDEARRNLMESGGKREVAMLFPVVFIILPVTVVFALYPGLVALRF